MKTLNLLVFSLLALILSCCHAHATLRTITVNGSFGQQSANHYFGLALPIPFHLFVQVNTAAQDEAPLDPTIGIYPTEGAYWGLSFGEGIAFHFFTGANTEVRIWNGKDGVAQAIGFGNEDGFSQYGLVVDPYRAYGFFDDLFFPVSGWDDSLHWLEDMAGDFRFETISYVFIFGHTAPWTETWLQTSTAQHYSID